MRNAGNKVRIGGASGFWGDSADGARQLVEADIDYLVFDYLAELTMSILVSARAKNPQLGYATDFVTVAMHDTLHRCVERGIKVISNAGGVNPHACARAVEALADELGLRITVAVVDGDDVMPLVPALRDCGVTDFYTGAPMPPQLISANAYLGGLPIAAALAAGADVVITGRVVDSAVVLGALVHSFGWSANDYDKLASASLAGHIIECGCQATGGLHTDWEQIPDWDRMGYPIIECDSDGGFVVSKPEGTGGKVLAQAVAEQMLYEIHDPAAYVLPDVVCDFTSVEITQIAADRVLVRGAKGYAPTDAYKVSATYQDGFSCSALLSIVGFDAVGKARRSGEAVLARTRRMLAAAGMADYCATHLEVVGAEDAWGRNARSLDLFEAVVRITARHSAKEALTVFSREISPAGTSWSPGTVSGLSSGRASVSALIRLFTCTVSKRDVHARLSVAGAATVTIPVPHGAHPDARSGMHLASARAANWTFETPARWDDDIEVPLIRIALARSGDKGDTANIGLIARRPDLLPYLLREVTAERVQAYFVHYVRGTVTRHAVPGVHAVNFVMTQALDGGGMASMRIDKLGKSLGQILLRLQVRIPASMARNMESL